MPFNSFENYPMSWMPDRESLKRPIYLSLAERLERDIVCGYLTAGVKLPPQRELADFLDINFTTVTRAYRLCELKGLIHAVGGSGTFVSSYASSPATISAETAEKGSYIDLAFDSAFEECNIMTAEAARAAVEKSYFSQLLSYDYPSGLPHHKMTGVNWLRGFGLETDEEHIAVASGTSNALALAASALFTQGDRIAVDRHTFANFIELARLYRLHLVPVDYDGEGMLPDELEAQCRLGGLQGIYLVPSCANPTTVMMSERRKRQLGAVIEKHGLILLEDDIHAFLTAGIVEDYKGPLFRYAPARSVYLCGTSKSICSGLRVAYMAFGEELRQPLLRAMFNINVKTSSLDAEIINEVISSGAAAKIAQKKRELACEANALFDAAFPGQPPPGNPNSFYRWLPLRGGKNGLLLERELIESGVRVYHSDRFLCAANQSGRFLRVSLAAAGSMARLEKGLALLGAALERLDN